MTEDNVIVEPVVEPATEPVVEEPVAEPTTEPVVEPVVVEPETDPVTEPEPVAEPAAEPAHVVEEPVVEPVVEEPVVETVPMAEFTRVQEELNALQERYNTLEATYQSLTTQFEEMKASNAELTAFRLKADNEAKDALIAKFYMLSEDDKKSVVEAKETLSIDEIEEKLSAICFRKGCFNLNEPAPSANSNETTPIVTFTVTEPSDATPAWVKAIENMKNNRI